MKFQKQLQNIIASLFLLNLVNTQNTEEKEELILTPGPITGKYNNNDLNNIYDESSIEIQCDGITCTSSSDNVLLEEGKVTLSNAGTYVFGGELSGQLNIAATEDDLIHLILRNATITSSFGPAVYAECKKLVITTEGQNIISDSENYPKDSTTVEETEPVEETEAAEVVENKETKKNSPNACIFVTKNLTFNGKGTLDVNGNFEDGIRAKKNLKFVSGKINIVSKGNAIKAKESISFKDAEINIDAGLSGIRVTKDTDPDEGFVVIEGGKFIIKAVKDAIHAETHLTISDGHIDIIECEEGLEAQMIDITGGNVIIYAIDDGINAPLIGASKDLEDSLTSVDNSDQLPPHSETSILPAEEETEIPIDEIEYIDDNVTVEAEEDSENNEENYNTEIINEIETEIPNKIEGNSTGNSEFTEITKTNTKYDEQVYIRITGGKVEVTVEGTNIDGMDSDGSIYFGGNAEVYVSTPYGGIFGHLGTLDSIGSKIFDIGSTDLLTSSGRFSGMQSSSELTVEDILRLYPDHTREGAEELLEKIKKLESSSALNKDTGVYDEPNLGKCLQPYIRAVVDLQEKDTPLKVLDNDGNVLIEYTPKTQYAIILYTSPKIVVGETYTVITGDITNTFVAKVDA